MRRNSWKPEEEQRLRALYPTSKQRELIALFGRTDKAIRSRAKLLRIKKARYRPFTAAEEALLRARYADASTKDLAGEMGRELLSLYRKAKAMGLHKSRAYLDSPAACRLRRGDHVGAAYRFQKGHAPANKGLRRPGWSPGRMKETQFKKGQRSRNYLPVGTVRADTEGFMRRKVADGLGGFGNYKAWEYIHKRVWADAHGPIPKGHILRFRDGDRSNCALSNLELLTLEDNMRRNTVHNLPPEIRQVIQLTGAVKAQITRRNKKNGKEPDPGSPRPSL